MHLTIGKLCFNIVEWVWVLSTVLRSLMSIISYIRQSSLPLQRDKVQNKMLFKINKTNHKRRNQASSLEINDITTKHFSVLSKRKKIIFVFSSDNDTKQFRKHSSHWQARFHLDGLACPYTMVALGKHDWGWLREVVHVACFSVSLVCRKLEARFWDHKLFSHRCYSKTNHFQLTSVNVS